MDFQVAQSRGIHKHTEYSQLFFMVFRVYSPMRHITVEIDVKICSQCTKLPLAVCPSLPPQHYTAGLCTIKSLLFSSRFVLLAWSWTQPRYISHVCCDRVRFLWERIWDTLFSNSADGCRGLASIGNAWVGEGRLGQMMQMYCMFGPCLMHWLLSQRATDHPGSVDCGPREKGGTFRHTQRTNNTKGNTLGNAKRNYTKVNVNFQPEFQSFW